MTVGLGGLITANMSTPRKPPASTRHSTPAAVVSVSTPRVYKYIRNAVGVVGTITDPSGITSNIPSHVFHAIGQPHAAYLDSHGYGTTEIECLSNAYNTTADIDDFVSLAAECGMMVMELEWFWALS